MTMGYTSFSSTATWILKMVILQHSKEHILPMNSKFQLATTLTTQDLQTEVLDVLKSKEAFIKTQIIKPAISRSLKIFLSCIQKVESPISLQA